MTSRGLTKFGRAMEELVIKVISANSPLAKGRVERKNRDLQDRLVKALRIAGINDMKTANNFLLAFLQKFTENLTLQYENIIFQVLADKKEYTLRNSTVHVLQLRDGSIRIEKQEKKTGSAAL